MTSKTYVDFSEPVVDAAWLNDVNAMAYGVKALGAVGDGVTDNYAAITAAMAAASAVGGGVVVFPPGGNYKHNSTLTIPANVLLSGYGSKLTYGGSGTAIQTATTGWTGYAGIEGFELAFGSATTVIQWNSAVRCAMRDIVFTGTSYTNTLIRLACNTTGTLNPGGNYNSVFNLFENVLNSSICGTFIQFQGNGAAATPVAIVTLNSFVNVSSDGPTSGCCVYGLDFNKWADNNVFSGMCRIVLPAISQAINAVGMIQNSAGPTQNFGCYANSFQQLAVDTFGTVGSDARVGVKLNFSAQTTIGLFFQNPLAVGGDLVVGANCYSYNICKTYDDTTNILQQNFFGTNVGIGAGKSRAYSLYLTNFTLTGTNQASVVAADTFDSTATGTGSGFTASNSTQATAYTMGAYYGFNATNPSKGAGSAITSAIAFLAQDFTSGVSNYGFYGNVSAGANKYNTYMLGTAQNAFSGDVFIFGAGRLGYGVGAGGAVTQATSKATAVTLNKTTGQITMSGVALAGATAVSFTLTNSMIAAYDLPQCVIGSGATAGAYTVTTDLVAAGSCRVTLRNQTAGSLSEAVVLNFSNYTGAIA